MTCKAAGRCGGFLYGMKNAATFSDTKVGELCISVRQLDLLAKICEQEDRPKMGDTVRALLKQALAESKSKNSL